MLQKKFPYFVLGLVVFLTGYFFLSGFVLKKIENKSSLFSLKIKKEKNIKEKEKKSVDQKKYVVKEGDDLWHIAEKIYGSGYNAYDIAMANKLSNFSLIEPGQELILPTVTPRLPTKGEIIVENTEQVKITGVRYTVQEGDFLWQIALRAYGDGNNWIRIAQANNITNPDLLLPGTTLIIPR